MRSRLPVSCLLLLAACHPAPAPTTPAKVLPLTSLRVYETGVGFFSRAGVLDASSATTLPVPAGHLDDALKSLLVWGGDKERRVIGVEFRSSVSRGMGRALAGLPADASNAVDWRDLLVSLTGAAVELRAGAEVLRGRVVDITGPKDQPAAEAHDGDDENGGGGSKKPEAPRAPAPVLLFVTDHGELRRFPSSAITAIRPLDAAFGRRLDAALDALSTRAAQTEHAIRLLASAAGPVTLGYIAETPIFRTSWRLVMDDAGAKPVLQGWALLHNDTDEDWNKVKIELVNGQPDSFLYPMAAPRYARRELIHPEAELSTVPQLLSRTPDAIWGDHVEGEEIDERYGVGGGGGLGSGYGRGAGGLGGRRASSSDSESDLLQVGNLAAIAAAQGAESGALFTYSLAEPLDLRAHGSALVPILAHDVAAEPIVWIDRPGVQARSAVIFTNSTGQTLPSGPIAFFAGGRFAGEAPLDRMKPGERRFLQFGNDLDVELKAGPQKERSQVKQVRFRDGRLEIHYLKTWDMTFEVENRAGAPRRLMLQLGGIGPNAQVTGADKVDFDVARAHPVIGFDVPAQKKPERKVNVVEGLMRATELDRLAGAELKRLAAEAALPEATRAQLAEAARRQAAIEERRAAVKKLEADQAVVDKDLERLRKHLEALGDEKSGSAAANPFVQRILAAEDRLESLRKQIETGESAIREAVEQLRGVLERI